MIRIDDLTVRFGGVVALDALTVELADDVVGLIGPNGAGKTTLTNVLSGFVDAASGSVAVDGHVLSGTPPHTRARWGLARSFQKAQIVGELTVGEHLTTVLDTRGESRAERERLLLGALDFVGLTDARHERGSDLDPYQQRMTEIARCLVGSPRLILLDEPGGGLADIEMRELHRIIGGIHDTFGAQVLLVDHDMDLIRGVCQSVVVLDFGKLIAFGKTEAVLQEDAVRVAYLGR